MKYVGFFSYDGIWFFLVITYKIYLSKTPLCYDKEKNNIIMHYLFDTKTFGQPCYRNSFSNFFIDMLWQSYIAVLLFSFWGWTSGSQAVTPKLKSQKNFWRSYKKTSQPGLIKLSRTYGRRIQRSRIRSFQKQRGLSVSKMLIYVTGTKN